MTRRLRVPTIAVLIVVVASLTSFAQQKRAERPPRTAWGDPDLQGNYTNKYETSTPFERPAQFEGRRLEDVSAQELADAVRKRQQETLDRARFLGGESLGEALDRVHPALERLLARDWHTALAVLHGGVNRIVISYALSGDRTYFGTFEQAPACINVLDLGDDGWIVRTVNYVPYDPLHPARTTTMEHLWEELRGYFES